MTRETWPSVRDKVRLRSLCCYLCPVFAVIACVIGRVAQAHLRRGASAVRDKPDCFLLSGSEPLLELVGKVDPTAWGHCGLLTCPIRTRIPSATSCYGNVGINDAQSEGMKRPNLGPICTAL